MRANKASSIAELLRSHYPDARCTLVFSSPFQCLCAVLLSAQCTDAKVNRVTPSLFSAYPSPKELSEANLNQVEGIIHSLGLSHSKAMHLIAMAKRIQEKYGGRVPDSYEELLDLPGVGNKTARVVLMECFHQPAFPVDTHVERVSTRLGLVREGLQPAEIGRGSFASLLHPLWKRGVPQPKSGMRSLFFAGLLFLFLRKKHFF